jgi:hypothetical protein
MRKWSAGLFIFGVLLAVPATTDALVVMAQKPSPTRAALTDTIVVGRVMGMEDIDVKVPAAPGSAQMTTYRIAVVSITELVRGKKELKQVRVGFVPSNVGPNANPGGGPGPVIRPGMGPVQLAAGQEGLFFLQKHATGDFFVVSGQFDFVSNQNKAGYENDLKDAKRAAKLLESPLESLKSKEQDDRYFTAALLITLYRTAKVVPNKQEPISVEESKLILQALAENENWKGQAMIKPGIKGGPIKGGPIRQDPMAPLQLFNMLGVNQQDGFTPPAQITSPDDYPQAARQWCQKNAGTYQIKRFVSAN